MKKTLLINIIIVVVFFLFDPFLEFCEKWADTYNLGAEMVLGMLIPLIFTLFLLVVFCSVAYSLVKCFANKEIKHLIPITVFVIGVIVYILISNPNSFWIRVINYYLNVWRRYF